MFTHFVFGTAAPQQAARFYAAVMPLLGFAARTSAGSALTFTHRNGWPWVVVRRPADGGRFERGNGYHVAFHVADTASVQGFHAAALAAGGSDEGGPGLRPHYAPDYYAAYVRDPDGNKLQAVTYPEGRRAGPGGAVISHITLGSSDLKRSCAFYTGLLATLGHTRLPEEESDELDYAFGHAGCALPVVFPQLAFDDRPARAPHGSYAAFRAAGRQAVEAFHREGLRLGGAEVAPPGESRNGEPEGYAAAICDPDGNVLSALCPDENAPGEQAGR